MKGMLKRKWAIPVAALVLSLSIGSVAFAAAASSSTDTTAAEDTQTTAASGSSGSSSSTQDQKAPDSGKGGEQRADETLQTGDILSKLTAAALAKVPGGKVVRVETDADGNAKYEVHMTKADGTPTTVYFDASLNYVKTVDGDGGGRKGGGQRADETLQTGDILSKLTAAALAKVPGGKVVRVETDADGNAKYEVHMTKADGTPTTVYFDASLNYVKTVDGDGGGHRAHDKDADDATNTSGTSGSSSTTNSSSTGA